MDRRDVLRLVARAGAAFSLPYAQLLTMAMPAAAQEAPRDDALGAGPFTRSALVAEARRLAGDQFRPRAIELPEFLAELSYDAYRDIRFRPEARIWRDQNRGFLLDLLHLGFIYRTPVRIFIVRDAVAEEIRYAPDMFDFGPRVRPPEPLPPLAFSGFRVRTPLNGPDFYDEFAVFQGASYFRAVGKGLIYGLSARGLAIGTGSDQGEEFPAFVRFWIEEPPVGAKALIAHALLDSPSITGAYRFTLRPGETTTIDVEATLFPRVEVTHAGLAPLTSMFFFAPNDRDDVDDYREAVHDSDGLAMWSGAGEWIWRPLSNPQRLQISSFLDRNPRGFGLIQRKRDFTDYYDLEARYDRRPTAWVEPIGDWGEGQVQLVEIPSPAEVHDNVVAYWRPKAPLAAGTEVNLTYRLHWGSQIPQPAQVARVLSTRVGASADGDRRLFVIDFDKEPPIPDGARVEVAANAGKVSAVIGVRNAVTGGFRCSFELDTEENELIELRVVVYAGDRPVSETWLYRWTP